MRRLVTRWRICSRRLDRQVFMMARFYKTVSTCCADRHVWFTATTPPDDGLRCLCGGTTWAEYCEKHSGVVAKRIQREEVSNG